jgi:TonB family protein
MRLLLRVAFLALAAAPAATAAPPSARSESDSAGPARARTNLATLFSDEDYPPEAVRNHEQGPVAFRLSVGPDGRPTACAVTGSSGSAVLDSTTCRLLMERAHFEPARDKRGRPISDSVDGRIIWRLPEDEEVPPRVQALRMLWSACLFGEVAKLATSDLADEEVVRRAFDPCSAQESLLAREISAPFPLTERRGMTTGIVTELAKLRAVLKAPKNVPPPPR